jgi:hypothetical protein
MAKKELTEKEVARRKAASERMKARHAEKKVEKDPEVDIDAMMEEGEKQQAVDLNSALIQQAIANFVAQQTGEIKKEKIVRKDRCVRHPDIEVKAGENCTRCIKQTNVYNERLSQLKFVAPCPKCGRNKRSEDGGCIKTFRSKKGAYACSICEIDYTIKGQVVCWKTGASHDAVDKEIDFRDRKLKQQGRIS